MISAAGWVLALLSIEAPAVEETFAGYGEAWSETDEVRRTALLELSFAEDGTYEDPQSRYEDREALFEGIASFQERNPGALIRITSGVEKWRVPLFSSSRELASKSQGSLSCR